MSVHQRMNREYHKVYSSRTILREFTDVLSCDRSPMQSQKPETIVDETTQAALTNFSLSTHGFGTPAILAAMNCLHK